MNRTRAFECPLTEESCNQELCKMIAGNLFCWLDSEESNRLRLERGKRKIDSLKREEALERPAGKREENAARKRLRELESHFLFSDETEKTGECWAELQSLQRRFHH